MSNYNELREIQHQKVIEYLKEFYPHILNEYDYDTDIELCENGDIHVDNLILKTNIKL